MQKAVQILDCMHYAPFLGIRNWHDNESFISPCKVFLFSSGSSDVTETSRVNPPVSYRGKEHYYFCILRAKLCRYSGFFHVGIRLFARACL